MPGKGRRRSRRGERKADVGTIKVSQERRRTSPRERGLISSSKAIEVAEKGKTSGDRSNGWRRKVQKKRATGVISRVLDPGLASSGKRSGYGKQIDH